MVLAYGSVRWWKIFSPYQFSGINRRFVAIFAVPLLSFHFISTNNPYTMNFRFIAADTLQKIIMLFPLAIWTNFTATPRGSNFNHADFDSMMGYDLYSVQSTSRGPTPRPSNFEDHLSSPRFGFYPAQRVPAAYPAPDPEFSSGLSKNSQQLGQAQPQTLPVPNNGAKASHDAKELHKFVWSSSASPVSEGGGDLHVFGGADYRASDQSGRSDQGAKEIRMLVPDDHPKRRVTNKAMVISVKPLFLFLGLILALFVPCNGDLGTAAQWIPPYMPNACGFDASQFPGNNMFAAAGESLWDSGAACGRQYMVGCTSAAAPGTCIAGQTIPIMIVDRALTLASPPSSEGTSMVLSGPAFQTIATTTAASINIDFQQI